MKVSVVDSTTVCKYDDLLVLHSMMPSMSAANSIGESLVCVQLCNCVYAPSVVKHPLSRHLNANGSVMAIVEKTNMYSIGSAKRFHLTAPT